MAHAEECWAKAESVRMNGAVLLARSEHTAEAAFDEALKVARSQNAKTWELRTALSLARLWRDQGKHIEAAISSRRSTAGSRKASTRRSSKKPTGYSTCWHDTVHPSAGPNIGSKKCRNRTYRVLRVLGRRRRTGISSRRWSGASFCEVLHGRSRGRRGKIRLRTS
jgi:hypothetical protein